MENKNIENWLVECQNVYYKNNENQRELNLSRLALSVLLTSNLTETVKNHENIIKLKYEVENSEGMLFAQMVLTRLLQLSDFKEQKIHWRSILIGTTDLSKFGNFRQGVEENLKSKNLDYILNIEPKVKPDFLKI